MKIANISMKFPDWETHASKAPSKVIERLMINLRPVVKINMLMYVDYVGDEDKKEVFSEYFNKEKRNLESYLSIVYQVNRVSSSKNLNKDKLEWLNNLVEVYKPKNISFNLLQGDC